ncbi:hypothetical protein P9D51_19510 [Bacillus sonorensis]|uniref:hypothetical protein n=1 Tax=Bacillus sonorensis TaxID=119858 RepID=UPI001F286D71|nr:hypothetical protein [Bacillus sonorensis]MCF7616499.1 hypothetical protein [Bacillus sonorensis]MCY8270317.1 hypothetical protein [Bacillus sonorensis]MCY8606457.1 hypothetical protein [Bacillus sonorensis]MCZ0068641.1 hypothetical protein [Bacillus sonorensis]MCZ0095036.1 hypothetical protein [Bacillus sonorensis]
MGSKPVNRGNGVKVLALCPGETDTAFFSAFGADESFTRKRMSPIEVVHAAFKGMEHGKSSVIAGRVNYRQHRGPVC